ncbi:type 11 methyltransferase [Nostoc carneum NIES-2107]|nr:type 11 methyltransferase [Nostoc carneum NIES-2107]
MPLYDSIGKQYTTTRIPDYRIVQKIIDLLNLPPGSLIADIGAGTGGYSKALANRGFSVYAVEPSSVMRKQASEHPQVQWFNGYAEALPLADKSVNAAISILTIHHFSDLAKSFQEMHRIIKDGEILLFTFDNRFPQKIWLYDYFPSLWEESLKFIPINEITSLIEKNTHRSVEVIPFILPYDLSDLFAAAAWRRPELYLQPEVRAGISAFAFSNPTLIASGVTSLAEDLSSGKWDAKYGDIRQVTEIDAGYRFLKATIVN